MTETLDAAAVLVREFLEIRARILELAAALDRLDRAAGSVREDARYQQIQTGLAVLARPATGRAEEVQMVFSLPYDGGWRASLNGHKV